jgi:hypothetical protein
MLNGAGRFVTTSEVAFKMRVSGLALRQEKLSVTIVRGRSGVSGGPVRRM